MTICPKLNCTFLESNDPMLEPPPLEPDPDISGYGVLIGFAGTGYITLVLLIVQYALGFAPDSDANPIDRGVIHWLWKRAARRPSPLWGQALERSILLMSDQQMITGIAILASGFFQLCGENSTAGIASYDWQIVVYLGWFSSLTHLTTLTALRTYMIEHPVIRLWRLFFMLVIVVMLIISLIPTMQLGWFYAPGSQESSYAAIYAGCYYRSIGRPSYKFDTNGLISMIISLLVLLVGYLSKSIKLFPRQSDSMRRFFRKVPGDWWKRRLDRLYSRSRPKHQNGWLHARYRIELAVLISIRVFLDIYHSVVWEILWLIFGIGWGTMHLVTTKLGYNAMPVADDEQESEWGFGQFISTFLLVLPLISLAEACYETMGKLQEEKSLRRVNIEGQNSFDSSMTTPVPARPKTLQARSSSTLPPSPSSTPPINLPVLTFPPTSEGPHTLKGAGERSSSPHHVTTSTQRCSTYLSLPPDADLSDPSLPRPLHNHDFYRFPWFNHLIIILIIEVIQVGIMVLYVFTVAPFEVEDIVIDLSPLWMEVLSVFPASVIYNILGLSAHERRERRLKMGKSIWRSWAELSLLFWKIIILAYIPVVSFVFFMNVGIFRRSFRW